ncbi:MAG TPA: SDR family oxidoreductase [Myxococcota bacterium]|nr:SDR family oxidoreductase [Myxococcota bacterium]
MKREVVIVTGASTSIGSSLVAQLLGDGYKVVAQINQNLGDLVASARKFPDQLDIVTQDLSDEARARELMEKTAAKHGRIDVLINTIGPMLHKPLTDVTPLDWREQVHFNLNLAFYLTFYAQQYLRASQEGHIVNFAFSGAEQLKGRVDSTAYCAAKAGLVVLTKSLASAMARFGIRVNALCPGLIEANDPVDAERKEIAENLPLGRPGRPSEVSQVLSWLLTESPAYVTGALISVSGAWEY